MLLGVVLGQARAVHPGSDGGLTYATPSEIRVRAGISSAAYALPLAGATDLAWSPAGRYLAYTVSSGDAPGLYVTDGAGCVTDRLTTDAGDRAPAFDGASLYFTRDDATLTFSYDLDGAAWSRSAAPAASTIPGTDVAVSVIEGYWAYVSPPGGEDPDEYVLVIDRLFEGATETVHTSPDPITGTEWAPDGSMLAFVATDVGGDPQVHLADFSGETTSVTQLTDKADGADSPAISPDGTELAYRVVDDGPTGWIERLALLDGSARVVVQGVSAGPDWRSLNPPPSALAPIVTTTSLTLERPPVPGLNDVLISVDPAPAAGTISVSVDGTEQISEELEEGELEAQLVLDEGSNEITATFGGDCPHRSSTSTQTVAAATPTPTPKPTTTPKPTPAPTPPPSDRVVTRVAGTDRYATAAATSRLRIPTPPDNQVVFIASGETFPDALAAGPAAGAWRAPVLLVRTSSIPSATANELRRMTPARIYLVGGPRAVSDSVLAALRQFTDSRSASSVVRVSGANRYATAAAVARLVPASGERPAVFVATGADFPDALAAGPAATKTGAPILLVERNRIPPDTARELARLDQARIYVIGGSAVISSAVRADLAAYVRNDNLANVIRLSGADRFATNVAVVQRFWPTTTSRTVVASGLTFPDALGQGPYRLPIHLVRRDAIDAVVRSDIRRLDPARIDVFGGTAVIAPTVIEQLRALGP